ncbi:20S-pre-rRNA D-site endonuclease nob1 [Cyphellophora attinorum]|uniref:20S-pre-rRNA D-site endonuclease NOB1 n=1 Tax=Cyphellophora attinorum TaxID=1664694 RepID=A0A0N1H732_9EURO|nr:20S-pre-rRNA D-site endonuclease nob1 [Phialophora attinorum]KPI42097.1 20S-pre-rRNA D-site endonuclease nob1 [Phialophora attinorum]
MASTAPANEPPKPCHTIVLDSSPLLLNIPGISTLRANGHELVTTPTVLAEIKNEEARSRVDTLYRPFLTLRTPKPESLRFVKEFARKTGDGAVLSQTDYEILALAYELECERNGGDWRLRNVPGQKRVNGSPPAKRTEEELSTEDSVPASQNASSEPESTEAPGSTTKVQQIDPAPNEEMQRLQIVEEPEKSNDVSGAGAEAEATESEAEIGTQEETPEDSGDSDEGWITPSNIKKHKARDDGADKSNATQKTLQVATMTGDFAMQNVLLQINLNLLSTKTCKRISSIKQFILRCHACFATTKDMSKQFCARCGKPTLTRVSCTTNDKGEVKLHLKANMQWNNRGNVFSVPKPIAGTANQKWKGPQQGGGQGGWGSQLILAEDQKEYIRAMSGQRRSKERDLMDEDTLPGILTGDRGKMGGRVKVGAGRNVNSRKR